MPHDGASSRMIGSKKNRNSSGHPSEQRARNSGWRDLRTPLPSSDVGPGGFDDEHFMRVGQDALHFFVESFPFDADARQKVRQTFALNADDAL